ncbi:MOP flippase family protein [Paenibacillus sp. 1P07SE]|uniref:MOP flippase family protein n=1 Tax=Paenibacillus sp. 1P07SE TaxID=3132209 RepID=UPI0039A49D01
MSLKGKGIAAMKWSSLSTVISIVIQMLQLVILSRLLSPEDYGLMGMIMVVVAAAVNFSDMGISNAIIHRQDVTRNHLSTLYILNIGTSAILCLVIFLSAPLVAAFYNEPRLVELVQWMSLLCLFPAFGQQFEVMFRKELKFNNIAKIHILGYTSGFVVAVLGAFFGYGVYALIGSHLTNALVRSLGLVAIGWRVWTPKLHFARTDLKGYLSFGVYQMSSNVLQSLISNLDYLIIGRLFGAQVLGYYNFAYQLVYMPHQKIGPLVNTVALPLFAKMQNDTIQLREGFLKVLNGVTMLNAPIYLGIVVTAPVLVPFVFGDQWLPSVVLIQILGVMMLIRSMIIPIQPLLQSKGRADIYFRYTLINVALQVPILIIGGMVGGSVGVALAFILVQVLLFGIQYTYAVRKMVGPCLPNYLRSVLPGLLCGSAMLAGVLLFNYLYELMIGSVPHFILQVAVGMILYGVIVYTFVPEVVQFAKEMVKRKVGKNKKAPSV